jgi:hypothetical protein
MWIRIRIRIRIRNTAVLCALVLASRLNPYRGPDWHKNEKPHQYRMGIRRCQSATRLPAVKGPTAAGGFTIRHCCLDFGTAVT